MTKVTIELVFNVGERVSLPWSYGEGDIEAFSYDPDEGVKYRVKGMWFEEKLIKRTKTR